MQMPHQRILIKISGEMLLGSKSFGLEESACLKVAEAFKEMRNSGHQVACVVGGGNIFRGLSLSKLGMERTPADQMGMLATLMNGVALWQALQGIGAPAKLMSALECPRVAETYNWFKAQEYLAAGEIVIFVGGTGSPYFTTDTAAALRASEIKADILLKATKVNGVYAKDPLKHPEAKRYEEITYSKYLADNLGVMDATAVALCMTNKVPIFVFSMAELGKISINSLLSERAKHGTLIS